MRVILLRKKLIIVLKKSPHRHDLITSYSVNSEVLKCNSQVEKKLKVYNNVNMLETDLDGKYFN